MLEQKSQLREVSPSEEVSASYPLQPVGFPLQPRVLFLSPCPLFTLAGLTLALSNQAEVPLSLKLQLRL